MKTVRYAAVLALATLVGAVVGGVVSAQAAEITEHPLGEHPAVLVKRQLPTVDTNRLILMHPAQLMVVDAPTPASAHPVVAVDSSDRSSAGRH
jgi:hypothetical protein